CPPLTLLAIQAPRDRRHLHSFPTRRSSDLDDEPTLYANYFQDLDIAINTLKSLVSSPISPQMKKADLAYASNNYENWLRYANTLDRKSTRLNSSHVKISYAVFCLKKKRTAT